jgi:hypothetical protein
LSRFAVFACAALVAGSPGGSAHAQSTNQFHPDYKPNESPGYVDNKPEWEETEAKLPAYPKPENLIGFEVVAMRSFRFFVDTESINPAKNGVVFYTMVARSGSGTENVMFIGLRCATGEQRIYANGRGADQTWSVVRDSKWKLIEPRSVALQYMAIRRDFFCPGAVPIMTRAEGIDALKRGYHPNALSNQSPIR